MNTVVVLKNDALYIRASMLHGLTSFSGKKEPSNTAKKMLVEYAMSVAYGIQMQDLSYIYAIKKGLDFEERCISLLQEMDGLGYKKNEDRFYSDLITGVPDILTDDCVIDIKNALHLSSFSDYRFKNVYLFQLNAYMLLTGRNKSSLSVFCLDNDMEYILKQFKHLAYGSQEIDLRGKNDDLLEMAVLSITKYAYSLEAKKNAFEYIRNYCLEVWDTDILFAKSYTDEILGDDIPFEVRYYTKEYLRCEKTINQIKKIAINCNNWLAKHAPVMYAKIREKNKKNENLF